MCRLLMMSGITDPQKAVEFMKKAKEPMSVGNNMGIGFSAVKNDGNFFTERWHNNDQFMDTDSVMTQDIIEQLKPFSKRLPNLRVNYSLDGEKDFSNITSMTMHTRYATCGKEFMNTHPFSVDDFSLVHNGIISNSDELKLNKISTCDSEAALQSYIQLGVNKDISKAQEWIDTLEGYWAFGIFSRDATGRRVLDIIRNSANLYATTVEGLGMVLATTQSIIESSALQVGLRLSSTPQLMSSNTLFRLDALTGEVLDKVKLTDSKLNTTTRTYWGKDFSNIFGSENTSTTTPVTSSNKSPTLPTWVNNLSDRNKGFKEPEIIMDNDALDFYEDEFQQLDDTGIPLVDRLEIYDSMFQTNVAEKFWSLPASWFNDIYDHEDFFDMVEMIEEAYDFYSGENILKMKG